MHVQPERLYFLFSFFREALSMVIYGTEKHLNYYFIQEKTLFFRSLNLTTHLLFEEMLVLTSY